MEEPTPNRTAILVLTGASGSGKTTLLLKLDELRIAGVECINCDRVNIEASKFKDPSDRQIATLRHWLSEIRSRKGERGLTVLDTQIRPHQALDVLDEEGFINSQVLLVDCDPETRNDRLRIERKQPELANSQMDCWAAYLRGQADALKLEIVDTSSDPIDISLEKLRNVVNSLLA